MHSEIKALKLFPDSFCVCAIPFFLSYVILIESIFLNSSQFVCEVKRLHYAFVIYARSLYLTAPPLFFTRLLLFNCSFHSYMNMKNDYDDK